MEFEGFYGLLPPGKFINSDLYCQQLMRIKQEVKKNRPELINRKGVLFHHDNARPHISLATQQILKVIVDVCNIGTKFLTAGLEEIGILLRDRTEKNVIVKPCMLHQIMSRHPVPVPNGRATALRGAVCVPVLMLTVCVCRSLTRRRDPLKGSRCMLRTSHVLCSRQRFRSRPCRITIVSRRVPPHSNFATLPYDPARVLHGRHVAASYAVRAGSV
ncbi:Histone-lysine N-methyltransferase SETMAR [Eumeta japonica]|uniref:Histone-lysine N-methyltransferase SETMAR n=1 Tax=Eumeta variegata TaxID=151549 RepID=A0A4C1Z4T8_EUMVA|nr:Histone-lysine N-methyltransferase SETMAR [Eumeta japonica]